ncbi:MAG TPA: LPS assembly lipoprotein LptE [Methylibium sp.]|uniref:LPS-assembly lipoprotein LptE n=1 Tax=Methylibium sp. TaxID=2067992 RepID=UPI002DBD987D|nr:LPS assembly lipoprotein LptE [Methylibium sp.]HEU4460408.1 LPS assembly lipoprotein LptE [Methylibium sp.]
MWSSERSRRALLGAALLAPVAAPLAGCGFKLRQPPVLAFSTIQLAGFQPRSAFIEALRRSIEASGATRVVETPAQAQVVLETIEEARDRVVSAQTAAGQVRDLTLRSRFTFRLRTPAGRVLIRDTPLILERPLSFNETQALAKEQEEATLYRAMQADIVDQVMRQLAAVPPP